ncbi:hypothetical protein [Nitrosomonas sp. Nm166]|uniref:hypothetical protein n=1 Tax=Nitrosomonas sp. Nm166 TaxID=1881054 RepID=UPI0008E9D7B6|nr:hypothetical protein [Nitrosomonas sp. Nm166]SFE64202.1 hypothetical protein SAMN05428977_102342 [Nitrosomonas sp. Nm166]
MVKKNFFITLIISSAFIFSGCNTMNKKEDNDSSQKQQPDSSTSTTEAHPEKPTKSIVPPSFGQPPRYRGSINPIAPTGSGPSPY